MRSFICLSFFLLLSFIYLFYYLYFSFFSFLFACLTPFHAKPQYSDSLTRYYTSYLLSLAVLSQLFLINLPTLEPLPYPFFILYPTIPHSLYPSPYYNHFPLPYSLLHYPSPCLFPSYITLSSPFTLYLQFSPHPFLPCRSPLSHVP